MEKKTIIDKTFDYDIAIGIIARMRSDAIRRKHFESTSEEEKQKASDEIKVYNAEESILNGYGSEDAKRSVYDKVFNYYTRNREQSRQKIVEQSDVVQEWLNFELAVTVLWNMFGIAQNARCAATSEEEREKHEEQLAVYRAEQRIINFSQDEDARLSIYDKVINYYCPILRAR